MIGESEPVPKVRPTRRQLKDSTATPFHNWYDAMAFLRASTLLAAERRGCSPRERADYFAGGCGEGLGDGEAAAAGLAAGVGAAGAGAAPDVVGAGGAAAAVCGCAAGLIQQE